MQVTNVKFSKTVQVSQYEPETVEFAAVLEEGESHVEAAGKLREEAFAFFGRKAGKVGTNTATTTEPKGESKEAKDDSKEEPVEASKTTKKVTKKSAANGSSKKKVTKTKKKNVAYNREVKAHKTQFAGILNENFEGWKADDDMAAAAKQASMDLNGVDMMDGEGKVLESFVEALTTAMEEASGL